MKSNYHIFYESLIRASAVTVANDSAHFDRILGEGRLSLLLEAFTNEDAQSLSDSLKKQKEITASVVNNLPDNMANTKDVLNKLAAEIDGVANTADIVVMSTKGDTKGLKKKIEDLNTVFMRVGNMTAAVVQTMINAAENLQPLADEYKTSKPEALTLSMREVKMSAGMKKEFAEIQKILKAVSDSYAVPDWQKSATEQGAASAQKEAGGMWGTVKGFFKSIFGQVVEKVLVGGQDAFIKDLSELSINDIIDTKTKMETVRKTIEPVTKTVSAQTTNATTQAATAAAAAAAPKAKLKSADLGKLNPEALKSTINAAARSFGASDDVVERSQISQHNRLILSERWEKLAGIKGDEK